MVALWGLAYYRHRRAGRIARTPATSIAEVDQGWVKLECEVNPDGAAPSPLDGRLTVYLEAALDVWFDGQFDRILDATRGEMLWLSDGTGRARLRVADAVFEELGSVERSFDVWGSVPEALASFLTARGLAPQNPWREPHPGGQPWLRYRERRIVSGDTVQVVARAEVVDEPTVRSRVPQSSVPRLVELRPLDDSGAVVTQRSDRETIARMRRESRVLFATGGAFLVVAALCFACAL